MRSGDLVLLKCHLRDNDVFAEAGTNPHDTGSSPATNLHGSSSLIVVVPCKKIVKDLRGCGER